tara:strand:+ start:649 stop:870 length:222 start_codon:yes stop_codon:yes gene_type:complete
MTMALSNSTTQKLANALTSEVIDYIHEDDRWAELMMEVIPDAISEKMGSIDNDLRHELSMCIMDRIYLKSANS